MMYSECKVIKKVRFVMRGRVAVMDLFWGRRRLWPSLLWSSWFVAAMDLAVIVLHVAIMDLFWGRYRLWPSLLWP